MESQRITTTDGRAKAQPVCPACGGPGQALGFSLHRIPVHSVRIHRSQDEARSVGCGELDLHGCASCRFIWNATFDPDLVDYSAGYEATQSYSGTYRAFMEAQAAQFIDAFALRGRTIIEIGCGHGEFLAAICETGGNTGIGYDPAFQPERAPAIARGRYTVRAEKFGRATAVPDADVICCRNTLEHLAHVQDFIRDLRDALGSSRRPRVVFQVPAWERIEGAGAFWDVYYEHCSYFSADSLGSLFAGNGFSVTRVSRVFADQYLLIEARPNGAQEMRWGGGAPQREVAERLRESQARWAARVAEWRQAGRRIVLWGAGSKAVAFLSAVGAEGVAGAVDINPNKRHTYLPLSALPVVSPDDLKTLRPDDIVVMNAAYQREIADQLSAMGVTARLTCLD